MPRAVFEWNTPARRSGPPSGFVHIVDEEDESQVSADQWFNGMPQNNGKRDTGDALSLRLGDALLFVHKLLQLTRPLLATF